MGIAWRTPLYAHRDDLIAGLVAKAIIGLALTGNDAAEEVHVNPLELNLHRRFQRVSEPPTEAYEKMQQRNISKRMR